MTNILQHFRVWAQLLEDSTHLRVPLNPVYSSCYITEQRVGWKFHSFLSLQAFSFCHSPVISECFQPCRILVSHCPEVCLISASWLPPSPLPPPPSSTSEVFPSCPKKSVELLKDVGTSRLSVRYKSACHTVTVTLKLDSGECICNFLMTSQNAGNMAKRIYNCVWSRQRNREENQIHFIKDI